MFARSKTSGKYVLLRAHILILFFFCKPLLPGLRVSADLPLYFKTMFSSLSVLTAFVVSVQAQAANLFIYPITDVNKAEKTSYFSDPFHVPYQHNQGIYISGTTHEYLECDKTLEPGCASSENHTYITNEILKQAANRSDTTICRYAGIHPFQSASRPTI